MAPHSLKYSQIAVKYDKSRKSYVNSHHKRREWTTVDLKITEELGGVKHHFVPVEDVRHT